MENNINRVLIVHPHLTIFGGAEILLCHFSQELKKFGIEVKLVTLSLSEECNKRFNKCIKFILPKNEYPYKIRSTGFSQAVGLIPEIIQLKKLIKAEVAAVDIINVHNFPSTWTICDGLDKPVVWTCNEPPALWNNPSPSLILKTAFTIGSYLDKRKIKKYIDTIIVSDNVNSERVIDLYGVKPEIINYGVDYAFFSERVKTTIRQEYAIENAIILLQVGLFSPQKNQLQSIRLLHEIRDNFPNVKLLLAGQGGNDYEKEVKQYAKEHSLEEQVLFLGHVDRERIRELYQIADIALFPTKAQGGWLSPFEAISASVPTIVSPELTSSSIIKNNNLGYVTEDYANVVTDIIESYARAKQMVEIAKQWVQDNLSWERYTKEMIEVFNKTVMSKRNNEYE